MDMDITMGVGGSVGDGVGSAVGGVARGHNSGLGGPKSDCIFTKNQVVSCFALFVIHKNGKNIFKYEKLTNRVQPAHCPSYKTG